MNKQEKFEIMKQMHTDISRLQEQIEELESKLAEEKENTFSQS